MATLLSDIATKVQNRVRGCSAADALVHAKDAYRVVATALPDCLTTLELGTEYEEIQLVLNVQEYELTQDWLQVTEAMHVSDAGSVRPLSLKPLMEIINLSGGGTFRAAGESVDTFKSCCIVGRATGMPSLLLDVAPSSVTNPGDKIRLFGTRIPTTFDGTTKVPYLLSTHFHIFDIASARAAMDLGNPRAEAWLQSGMQWIEWDRQMLKTRMAPNQRLDEYTQNKRLSG